MGGGEREIPSDREHRWKTTSPSRESCRARVDVSRFETERNRWGPQVGRGQRGIGGGPGGGTTGRFPRLPVSNEKKKGGHGGGAQESRNGIEDSSPPLGREWSEMGENLHY